MIFYKYYILLLFALYYFAVPTWAQDTIKEAKYDQIRISWNKALKNKRLYKRQPTTLLVETVKSLKPGTALDVAMGTGRNAIYLAKQGWSTTGFDISDEALDSANAHAQQEGVTLETIVTPAEYFDYGENKWDLISFIYADAICKFCLGNDVELVKKLKLSLKPGGILVYEWFTAQAIRNISEDQSRNLGCSDGIVHEAFKNVGGFEFILYEEEMGVPDFDPTYKFEPAKLIYMVVRKK